MAIEKRHLKYITDILIPEIVAKLVPEKLIHFDVQHAGGLDGFMSALYRLSIKTLDESSNKEKSHELIAKFMKGDESFRISSRCYIQFQNEIFIYSQVIPYYSDVLSKAGIETIRVEDWIAKTYVAKYGQIDGLSDDTETSNECVLVLENLKPKGYAMGPRLYLNQEHMFAMMKPLAEYHAMTYVLKVQKDPHLEKLINSIVPLPFIEKEDAKNNFYDAFYRNAFDRFFEYFERCKDTLIDEDSPEDVRLEININKLNSKYGPHPTRLLEFIRTMGVNDDRTFAAILHGDFNRNNVMFRYENGDASPKNAKLIDFQELRYGSPCIDLSLNMYIHMDPAIRDEFWIELLKYYHNIMFTTMSTVLKPSDSETTISSLETYSYDKFYRHFQKYAFYGVIKCMHFLPWFFATEEELNLLSMWFERDVFSNEFRKLSIETGGDYVNHRIFDIVKHAHKMGYMDAI